MSKRNIFRFLLLPTVVGLLATTLVYVYMTPAAGQVLPTGDMEMVDVVLAREGVPAKTPLSADMLVVESMPSQFVTRYALTDPADAIDLITTVPLAEGEMLLSTKLAGEQQKAGLAYHVPAGLRAVSLPVNEVTGVGGFVEPGDRVDVVVSLVREEGEAETQQSVLVLQNLLVLGVGSRMEVGRSDSSQEPNPYSHVTLAATPEQAVTLTTADYFAAIRLLLRPAVDEGEDSPGVRKTIDDIGG